MSQVTILADIMKERKRQEILLQAGKFHWTCASPNIKDEAKLAVLAEEFGEVANLVVETLISPDRRDIEKLRAELTQVAAVCVAWLESL
jgi:hypothetical protein